MHLKLERAVRFSLVFLTYNTYRYFNIYKICTGVVPGGSQYPYHYFIFLL